MTKQHHHRVLRKKLRKPSAGATSPAPRHWWHFGLSEGALNKSKLLVGLLVAIVALASGFLTLLKIYASDEATFKKYADRAVAWHYKTYGRGSDMDIAAA
ncbi:MAG: hypothetical protein V4843_17395 [Pseudomonadota bacterium]